MIIWDGVCKAPVVFLFTPGATYANSLYAFIPLQQVKYKEKFDKEVRGKRPQYDLKESKIYKTLKDANNLASEVGASKIVIIPHLEIF